MKTPIVVDGESRLQEDPAFKERLRKLRDSVEARHAAELARAGFFRRLVLRWRISAEYRAKRRKIVPSPNSLYSNAPAANRYPIGRRARGSQLPVSPVE